MKFIYVDESGARGQGDVFVMCGLMIDAYKLRKKTEEFDQRLEALFAKHPGNRADFKTTRFINGRGGWREVDAAERKEFLKEVCELAAENGGKIFGFGLSFAAFDSAVTAGHAHYAELVAILEPARETLGRCPDEPCVKFYKSAKHPGWKL